MKIGSILFVILLMAQTVVGQLQHKKFISEMEKGNLAKTMNFKSSGFSDNFDIIYHRLNWVVDPAVYSIKGDITSYFKIIKSGTSSIYFDLSNPLVVDSVIQRGTKLPFTHQNELVKIDFSQELSLNKPDSLTVYYHGVPPSNGFGSFVTQTHSGAPVLWTLSEPYGARDWWPCKQSLTDKIDSIDVYVTAPAGNKVASNGILISEKTVGNEIVTHWKHRYPIATYLVAIAVTNYTVFSDYARIDGTDSLEIMNYVYPENYSAVRTPAAYIVKVIELFSNLFIPYPFFLEKYGQAQFGWGGGMEHQTMTFISGFDAGLITHELSHQWFGDYVTCASWKDIWINESFATYCEGLAIENLDNPNWLNWKHDRMQQVLDNAEIGSIIVDDTTSVNRIFNYYLSYQKGAMVLNMLRYQIGDEAFFSALKEHLTNPATSRGFASTEQVKHYFEQAADTTLDSFFEDWFYGQGYPIYNINWEQNIDNQVTIKISQTTTHSSVSFFPNRVPVLLIGDTQQQTVSLYNTSNSQVFTFNPGFEVNTLQFDPEYTILAPHPAVVSLKIDENNLEHHITIIPNPALHEVTIKSARGFEVERYQVISVDGRSIITGDNTAKTRKIHIDLSEIPAGNYYIRVFSGSELIVEPFIKMN